MESQSDDVRVSGASVSDDSFWNAQRVARVSWLFVGLGTLLRLVRYGVGHPLWGDEAFLASNLIDRDFAMLAQPLSYVQVSPILFLWIEKAMVLAFGFSVWSLRFVPIFASILGLFVFRHLVNRLLKGTAQIWAVAILAVGFYPIRHGGEIKPYATDFLASVILLTAAVRWLQRRDCHGSLWILAAIGPIAVAISHPAIFIAAAVGLVLATPVLKSRQPKAIVPFVLYGLATGGVFLLILLTITQHQSNSVMSTMRGFWVDGFPPVAPSAFVSWMIRVHTSHMFSYPAGGDHGASTLTTVFFVIGAIAMMRRGSRSILTLLLVPFGLGILAAAMGRYPYGGSARTMQYVVPSIIVLSGLGVSAILERWPRTRWRNPLATAGCGLLACVGFGLMAWDIAYPYKSVYDRDAREFARSFWARESRDAELVCAAVDLGVNRESKSWKSDRSAIYLCHRQMFADDHADLKRVRASHPLRAVVFGERPEDRKRIDAWLLQMTQEYDNLGRREVYANRGVINRAGSFQDRYVIYDFVPKSTKMARQHEANQDSR